MANIEYAYPSPTPGEQGTIPFKTTKGNVQAPPTPRDSKSPPIPDQFVQVKQEPQFSQGILPVVRIPAPPPNFSRDEYIAPPPSPKRRKLSHDADQIEQLTSQKHAADIALRDFDDLVYEIMQAQSTVEVDGPVLCNAHISNFFEEPDVDARDELVLNTRTLERVWVHIKKLKSLNKLKDVPQDHLLRLQQLCEPSIERGQTLNVRYVTGSSFDEEGVWQRQLLRANQSLHSALVSLSILAGLPEDAASQSPDIMGWSANLLVNVCENCLIPVVESRPEDQANSIFTASTNARDALKHVIESARKLIDLMATVCAQLNGERDFVNVIEFLAVKLIFVQNASSEKGSALGLQTYEKFRKLVMAVLSRIYARFPEERPAIMDEILTSLDKLPSTSRSARQFRLSNGQSIQLISALFMQLVQTTAMTHAGDVAKRKQHIKRRDLTPSDDELLDDRKHPEVPEIKEVSLSPTKRLELRVEQLFHPAAKSAQDIVSYLVTRASKTTKTGDSPYRSILDLLVEDLLSVLPSYEWPAAEMLLRVLAARMLDLAKNEKAASGKNMALECLGNVGSAISKLSSLLDVQFTSLSRQPEIAGSKIFARSKELFEMHTLAGGLTADEMVAIDGPFFHVMRHLKQRTGLSTMYQHSAQSYFAAHLAKLVSLAMKGSMGELSTPIDQMELLVVTSLHLLSDDESTMPNQPSLSMPDEVVSFLYLLSVLNLSFCRRLPEYMKILSTSFTSDQALVRSRSLKSFTAVLEADSSLLDRDLTIADDVFRCVSDESANVRDSALFLIARFIVPRPALQTQAIRCLLDCVDDEKVSVQKRAIGHLKDIYIQETRMPVKVLIARKVLYRLSDHEEVIAKLTHDVLSEIWIKPVLIFLTSDDVKARADVAVKELASTMMSCVLPPTESRLDAETLLPLLKKFFATSLRGSTASSIKPLFVKLVDTLFDHIISTEKNRAPLLVLAALAEAEPKLMPPPQLSKLRTYLVNVTNADLPMFQSATGIFCLVLADLPESQHTLVKAIQDDLMPLVGKLNRRDELDMVMRCLRVIDNVLHNTERPVRLAASIFNKLQEKLPPEMLEKFLRIAGSVGRYLNLEKEGTLYSKFLKAYDGKSISAHFAKILLPYSSAQAYPKIRIAALQSLGAICQSSPTLFNNKEVRQTFFGVLDARPEDAETQREDQDLKRVVLGMYDELYGERAASKEASEKAEKDQTKQALKQIGGDDQSRDQDSAVSSITPGIVDRVLKISLAEDSENALLAAQILSSISRQGLIHPKQCLGAFVAFSTSANDKIAQVGHRAQHLLHEQYESHCEREYKSAIVQAFKYQTVTSGDSTGATYPGLKPRLGKCFDIVMTSSSKFVKKFFSGILTSTALEFTNAENILISKEHVLFTRYAAQNIALADYRKVEELYHVILQVEIAYGKAGAELAQAIETAQSEHPDIVTIAHDNMENVTPRPETRTIDPALIVKLRRLAPAAACLLLLIETRAHLLRQYNIGKDIRLVMDTTKQAKETNKAPSKVHGFTGERFYSRSNQIVHDLDDPTAAMQLCKTFVEAMLFEEKFDPVNDEGAVSSIERGGGHVPELARSYSIASTPSKRGRKRKGSTSASGTPSKKPRGRAKKTQRRSSSAEGDDEDDDDDNGSDANFAG